MDVIPKPKVVHQYIGAAIVSLGGFSLGTGVGWSSPSIPLLVKQMPKEKNKLNWIISSMPIGSAVSNLGVGFLIDTFGRKYSLVVMGIVTSFGYVILMFATNVPVYCAGRFVKGFGAGSFCVTCPTYISEFAHKDIRGHLIIFFQIQVVTGILVAYCLGEFESFNALNIPFAIVPIVMDICVLFLPESPIFLYKNGKEEATRQSLQFFRGTTYPLDDELDDIEKYTRKPDINVWKVMAQKSTIKGFTILMVLHLIQQLSGINAVNYYSKSIFKCATPSMAGIASIVIAAVRVIATGMSSYVVDRVGRRILWLVSLSTMAVMLLFIGFHFHLIQLKCNIQTSTGYAALVCIYVYSIAFSFGAGPLPWVAVGELLPIRMKFLVSIVTCISSLMIFVATNTFPLLVFSIGPGPVFWSYCGVSVFGFIFVFLFVFETKGQTLEDIQRRLGRVDT